MAKPLPRLSQKPYCRKKKEEREEEIFPFAKYHRASNVVFLLSLFSFFLAVNLQVLSEPNYYNGRNNRGKVNITKNI